MRVAVLILGVIIMLSGAACAVGGGAVAIIFGPDGRFQSDEGDLRSDTRALVFEADDIGDGDPDAGDWFNVSDIKVRIIAEAAAPGDAIFVGLGRAADVDRYVATFQHDVVTGVDYSPFDIEAEVRGGSGTPGDPAAQDFWLESATGTGKQQIDHALESGDFRVVVMNADGSPGIDAEGSFGVKVPYIFGIGIGLLAAGIFFAIVGLVMIVMMAMRIGRSAPAAPAAPPAPPTAPPPAAPAPPAAPPS